MSPASNVCAGIFLLLATSVVAGGCMLDASPEDGGNHETCTQDSECPVGQTCIDGPARWGCDAGKKHYDNGMFTNAALRNTKLTSANPLPIRQLTRLTTGASTHDPVDVIDPRPASGSPMASSSRNGLALTLSQMPSA